jgi:arylsulfatase A-like enzyme
MLRWNTSHLTWPDWQKVIATYWGYCSFIDDQVKRILQCLEETGLADNTVIIYSADHGGMLGGHRLFNIGMHMYEETYHIPLLVSWPRVTPAASVCHSYVSLVDIMPTLLHIGGAEVPEGIDGRLLTSFLKGGTVDNWPDDVYAEFHGYESALCTIRMVRTKSWKYVYNPCSEDELYDMKSDPFELNNVASKLGYKHELRRMKARLVKWLRQTNDTIVQEDTWKANPYDLYVSKREA